MSKELRATRLRSVYTQTLKKATAFFATAYVAVIQGGAISGIRNPLSREKALKTWCC